MTLSGLLRVKTERCSLKKLSCCFSARGVFHSSSEYQISNMIIIVLCFYIVHTTQRIKWTGNRGQYLCQIQRREKNLRYPRILKRIRKSFQIWKKDQHQFDSNVVDSSVLKWMCTRSRSDERRNVSKIAIQLSCLYFIFKYYDELDDWEPSKT